MREPKKLKPSSSKSIEKKYRSYLIRYVLPGVVVAIIAGYSLAQFFNEPIAKAGSGIVEDLSAYTLKETRATLSPALFQGKIARAYQIAQEMPKVLDQLYCYCKCEENFGHKGLLSCYVDQHGANWGICMDEAQLASEMYRNGHTIREIRRAIDKKYG